MAKTFVRMGITKLTDIILNRQINIGVKTKYGLVKQSKSYLIEKAILEVYGNNGWQSTITVIKKNE